MIRSGFFSKFFVQKDKKKERKEEKLDIYKSIEKVDKNPPFSKNPTI